MDIPFMAAPPPLGGGRIRTPSLILAFAEFGRRFHQSSRRTFLLHHGSGRARLRPGRTPGNRQRHGRQTQSARPRGKRTLMLGETPGCQPPRGLARPPGGPCERMPHHGPPGGRPLPASCTMQKTGGSPDDPKGGAGPPWMTAGWVPGPPEDFREVGAVQGGGWPFSRPPFFLTVPRTLARQPFLLPPRNLRSRRPPAS